MSTPRLPEALRAVLLAVLTASACVGANAAAGNAADAPASERARIARERAAVEARSKEAEAACASQFAVSSCLRQARAERRSALRQLDRQGAALDEAQRRQRAVERLARIRERQEAAARRQATPPVEVRTRGDRATAPERSAAEIAAIEADQARRAQRSQAAASAADAKAAQRVDAAARRTRQADSHRRAVEKRQQEQAAKGAPAASLPVPPSASAAR
jgi:colicin import membrane protein